MVMCVYSIVKSFGLEVIPEAPEDIEQLLLVEGDAAATQWADALDAMGNTSGSGKLEHQRCCRHRAVATRIVMAAMLTQLSLEEKQKILEIVDVKTRLEYTLDLLQRETETQRLQSQITSSVQKSREMELRQAIIERQIQEVQKDLQKLRAKTGEDLFGEVKGNDGEAEEVDEWKRRTCEYQTKRVNGERILMMPPSPFQKPILELLWIPTEFPLHQQIHCAGVMPVVLKHELFPRQ